MIVHGFTENGYIEATIVGERWTIPNDLANHHRQMIAEWEAEGNVIPTYVPPVAVTLPDLAPYQFRAMLTLSGNQDALYAFIAALPEPNKTIAQSKLEYSLSFRRNNDLVMAAQGALGLTEQELDALWRQASLIL